jgi:hypothetical protein
MLDLAVSYAGIITLFGFALLILIAIAYSIWSFITDMVCLIFHKCEPRKIWNMNPFGIGGCHEEYAIVCTKCDRAVKLISKSQYYDMLLCEEKQ